MKIGNERFETSYRQWFVDQVNSWTDDIPIISPSEWAEAERYLPSSVTRMPGYYSYSVNPLLQEIVDCMDTRSPVREVSVMKGSQVGCTTGVLENTIGYCMRHNNGVPVMMLTADDGLVKKRMEKNITPMLTQSNLMELVQSSDPSNPYKRGKTSDFIGWKGGGSLSCIGARSASAMRSDSVAVLLIDESDGFPTNVGSDGCPMKLAESRCQGYWTVRKIARLSTPTIEGVSKIAPEYNKGDQRKAYVKCKNPECGEMQVLKFKGKRDDGSPYGLVWEFDYIDNRIKPGSVRYACIKCGFKHRNSDKTFMFRHFEWRPTAVPITPDIRSYHLPALYSPPGMYSWDAIAVFWTEAWDDENNRPRDLEKLQVFYNNILGEPFVLQSEKLTFSTISGHRRYYKSGTIPNEHALRYAGGRIGPLTCAVDVAKSRLDVGVFGWAPGRRPYLIEYLAFEGDTSDLDNEQTWGELAKLIETKTYQDEAGNHYPIQTTFVDAGFQTKIIYEFCANYQQGVFPIMGKPAPASGSNTTVKEYAEFKTSAGGIGYTIWVDHYKDIWGPALRRSWSGQGEMPLLHFNAPVDITDKSLRELTTEYKRERKDNRTKRTLRFEWYRPGNVRNELWDVLIYSSCALDLLAREVCTKQIGLEFISWTSFFDYCEKSEVYYFKN